MGRPRRSPVLSSAQRAAVSKLIRDQGGELKYIDSSASAGVDSDGTAGIDSAVDQGDGKSERIGNYIKMQRYIARWQVTVADATNMMRIIMLQWKPNTASDALALTDVMESAFMGSATAPLSTFNQTNYGNYFRILYDELVCVSTDNPVVVGKIDLDLSRCAQVKFGNDASASAAGHLYLLRISDSTAISHPDFTYVGRLLYRD